MVVGMFPFTADNLQDLNKAICKGDYDIPSYISENCRNLLSHLLSLDVEQRFNAE